MLNSEQIVSDKKELEKAMHLTPYELVDTLNRIVSLLGKHNSVAYYQFSSYFVSFAYYGSCHFEAKYYDLITGEIKSMHEKCISSTLQQGMLAVFEAYNSFFELEEPIIWEI